MKIVTMIQTDLKPETATQLREVKTQNRKEVVGTCVMFVNPCPDTLPSDIRAVSRESEYLKELEKTAKLIALTHIRGDLEKLINDLAIRK